MSEMIERVSDAIEAVPSLWVRDNRWGKRGYEVGYVEGDVISDESIVILGSFPTSEEASAFAAHWTRLKRASAAIEAMREPTEAMADAGYCASAEAIRSNMLGEVPRSPPVEAWRAMIDVALEG